MITNLNLWLDTVRVCKIVFIIIDYHCNCTGYEKLNKTGRLHLNNLCEISLNDYINIQQHPVLLNIEAKTFIQITYNDVNRTIIHVNIIAITTKHISNRSTLYMLTLLRRLFLVTGSS